MLFIKNLQAHDHDFVQGEKMNTTGKVIKKD
jgi:hypothetical protein